MDSPESSPESSSEDEKKEEIEMPERKFNDDISVNNEEEEVLHYQTANLLRLVFDTDPFLNTKLSDVVCPRQAYQTSTPFHPIHWPKRNFPAFQLVRRYGYWAKLVDCSLETNVKKHSDCTKQVVDMSQRAFQGVPEPKFDRSSFFKGIPYKTERIVLKRPFGPESLHSSSCLQQMKVSGQDCLVYSKLNSIKVQELLDESEKKSFSRYTLSEDNSYELVNYDIPLDDFVYGFSVLHDTRCILLRHRKCVSLIDVEGDIKSTHKRNNDILSLSTLDFRDDFAFLDGDGNIAVVNVQSGSYVWEGEYKDKEDIISYQWADLSSDTDGYGLRLVTRRSVKLFDLRSGNSSLLYVVQNELPVCEVMSASIRNKKNTHQWYCASSEKMMLLDDRNNKEPIQIWDCHHQDLFIGGDYCVDKFNNHNVVFYSDKGSLSFIRNETLSPNVSHLVSHVSPFDDVCNTTSLSPLAQNYLDMPCNGLAVGVSNNSPASSNEELDIFLCNISGSIFHGGVKFADLTDKSFVNPERNEAAIDHIRTWDEDVNANKFWKKPSVQCATKLILNYRRKNVYVKRCDRIPRQLGDAYSSGSEIENEEKSKKKNVEVIANIIPTVKTDEKIKYRRNWRESNRFCVAAPKLRPINLDDHDDEQGQRIAKIFNGQTIFPHLKQGQTDINFVPAPKLRRARTISESSLASHSTVGGKNENYDDLDEFDPQVTSTQQSDLTLAATPLVASQTLNDTLANRSMARSMSKKKKKGLKKTGF